MYSSLQCFQEYPQFRFSWFRLVWFGQATRVAARSHEVWPSCWHVVRWLYLCWTFEWKANLAWEKWGSICYLSFSGVIICMQNDVHKQNLVLFSFFLDKYAFNRNLVLNQNLCIKVKSPNALSKRLIWKSHIWPCYHFSLFGENEIHFLIVNDHTHDSQLISICCEKYWIMYVLLTVWKMSSNYMLLLLND